MTKEKECAIILANCEKGGIKVKSDMILTPITHEEKRKLEDMNMQDNIIVLYRTMDSSEIEVGMLSRPIREYFPDLANIWKLSDAIDIAFFYGGNKEIGQNASKISDRPVYKITTTKKRTVAEYEVINGDIKNNLNIWLEDIIDGTYNLEQKNNMNTR